MSDHTEKHTYRIGSRGMDRWWGEAFGRQWGTFEAVSDKAAWEEGQRLWAATCGPNTGLTLELNRQLPVPRPKILTPGMLYEIRDTPYVWVRVAIGRHQAPWPEETT